MYYLFYITKYVHVIHTLASHLQDNRETGVSQGSMSQSRQGTPSVTATCLVLSSFWQHVFFTYFPTSDFDQTWSQWPVPWPLLRHGQWWGHDGVTGVKKVIFTKKASSPSEYLVSMRDLCICISLTPSTKVMVLKIHLGSFGVTGVKSSFSPKGIKSFRIRSIDA